MVGLEYNVRHCERDPGNNQEILNEVGTNSDVSEKFILAFA